MSSWTKYVFPKYADKSIKEKNNFRFIVAKEQADLNIKVPPKIIEEYIKEFLNEIGINTAKVISCDLKKNPIKRGFYADLKTDYHLLDKKDIIWMKFTTDGDLGVVASSSDINFSMDNTSGKILKYLGKEWDDSKVIIIPINFEGIPHLNRHRVESGLGNYLISKGVPILDYYSHNL